MKKSLLLFFILLTHLFSQENKLFWDGGDWNRLSNQTAGYPEYTYLVKAAYINGIMDGRLYDFFKLWPADSTLADSLVGSEVYDYLKTSEIIRGLDNFYSDPLNHYIPISSAAIIVNMYAEGHSPEIIEAYTTLTREWINRLILQMQDMDMFQLMEKKQKKNREINR